VKEKAESTAMVERLLAENQMSKNESVAERGLSAGAPDHG
jgi:hypothetical protein